MKTKFFRFLLLQSLSSINISKEKFNFIPMQNFRQTWSDEKLYSKYNLSDSEIEIIEKTIKHM
jgi:site-specific DNA-methyltransferase (adenine-specific)